MLKPLALALTLAAAPAFAFDLDQMSETERAAFREEVRSYLLDNPEVLMEAIQVLETREAETQGAADADLVAQNAEALFEDDASWVGGNPDGDVTVVEFMDYRCGYCRRAFPEVAELVESDGNIRFVVKEFPILGEQSVLASRFAIATQRVAGDDAYETVHEALMGQRAEVTETSLEALAQENGLDWAAIWDEMSAPEVAQRIGDVHRLGSAMGIQGTPSFVIGDQMVRGYVPLEEMRAMVEDERG